MASLQFIFILGGDRYLLLWSWLLEPIHSFSFNFRIFKLFISVITRFHSAGSCSFSLNLSCWCPSLICESKKIRFYFSYLVETFFSLSMWSILGKVKCSERIKGIFFCLGEMLCRVLFGFSHTLALAFVTFVFIFIICLLLSVGYIEVSHSECMKINV